jgi:hypothetical protein
LTKRPIQTDWAKNQDAEKCDLRRHISRRADAGEFFLLKNQPLRGDFAGGVVRAHEREKDDLKHDEARDEASRMHEFLLLENSFFICAICSKTVELVALSRPLICGNPSSAKITTRIGKPTRSAN